MIISLAWRNIWRNPVRSLVIMISVAAGLFAVIAVLALYKGMMQSRVRTVIYTETGHIQLHDPMFKNDYEARYIMGEQMIQAMDTMKGVAAVAPRVVTMGMLSTASGSSGVQINGILSLAEEKVSGLKKKLLEGSLVEPHDGRAVLIGKKLADKLKIRMGSKVVITTTDSTSNMISSAFRVKGIYQSANTPLDELNVYVDLYSLQSLLGIGPNIHELSVILQSDDLLDSMQAKIKAREPRLSVESWRNLSPETDLMVRTIDVYSYIILIIILIALSFGIVNTMMMTVLERKREIGMMMALGTSRPRILVLILLETFFLTTAGTPIALITGAAVTGYYHRHGLDLSGLGQEMLRSFGYEAMIYPSFPVEKLAGILMLVFITAILSSLFPAWKSLQTDPAKALQK